MKSIKKLVSDYICILSGSFILAFSINFFLVPQRISTGGVSGIGTVLLYLFNIPLSVTVLAVNALLFLFGYGTLQKSSLVKTVSGIVFLSFFLEVTKLFGAYSDDIFISSVFGGIIAGIGVGLTVSRDASTGGSDFAALMLRRLFPHISLARLILIIDFFIIVLSGIVFENYTITLYSLVSLYIGTKVTDMILVSGDYAKSVFIISDKTDEISNFILNDMNRGVTGIYSRGYYKRNDNMMLMCIVRSKEIPHLLKNIKEFDSNAFIIISEVREVHGAGFKEI